MSAEKELTENISQREIISTRLFKCSRTQLFQAWKFKAYLGKWWGPKGFSNTYHKFEFKAGGESIFTMHGPDGKDYPNEIIYKKIDEPRSIVLEHVNEPKFELTATFEDRGAQSVLIFRMLFASARTCEKVRGYVIPANEENFDRLEQVLKEMPNLELQIVRTLESPAGLVFRVFTESSHLVHWWGPKGFTMGIKQLDLRPGGIFHYSMKSSDGLEMFGRFDFMEVDAPGKLVFTNSFSDAEGNIIRAPFSASWPLKVYNIWTFAESEGKTTLMLRGSAYEATEEEERTFGENLDSMEQGFGGTFEQLREYLLTLK